jgi:hypothetical protein
MSRSISTEEQDEPLEALLQQQRDRFVRFYIKNSDLFTPREEAEAFRYFDAEGEELTPEQLYARREACLNNLNSAENYAKRTKNREQELRKEVQSRLGALPIAFDTKKRLLDEFFSSDLRGKEDVLKAVQKEEARVAEKRRSQHESIESKKTAYHDQLMSGEFQIYFSDADREFAWQSLLAVVASLRTNAARISRIQIFIDTLPGSLAYAKAQDEEYQKLLKKKVLTAKKQKLLLTQFREQSCVIKSTLLKALQEQEAEQETVEQNTTTSDDEKSPDTDEKKALEKTTFSQIQEYQRYYEQFPHGKTPEQFEKLSPEEKIETLKNRQQQNTEELTLLNIYLSLDNKTDGDKSIRVAQFKKLTLTEKKAHIDQFLKQIPDDLDASNLRGIELLKIVVDILRNKNRTVFASDQERIKLVNERIKDKRLSVHFEPHHFYSIKAILADFDEDRWEQPKTLSLAEKRLREREYVG